MKPIAARSQNKRESDEPKKARTQKVLNDPLFRVPKDEVIAALLKEHALPPDLLSSLKTIFERIVFFSGRSHTLAARDVGQLRRAAARFEALARKLQVLVDDLEDIAEVIHRAEFYAEAKRTDWRLTAIDYFADWWKDNAGRPLRLSYSPSFKPPAFMFLHAAMAAGGAASDEYTLRNWIRQARLK